MATTGVRPVLGSARPTWWRPGLVAVVLLTVVWRAASVAQSSWSQDDWAYFSRATDSDLLPYAFTVHNGHLMVLPSTLMWLMGRFAPLDFRVAVLVTSLLAGGIVVVWAQLFERVVGPRLRVLVAAGLVGLSPVMLPVGVWWIVAIESFPLLLTMGLALRSLAGHLTGGARRDLVHACGWLVVGMFCWQKAALALVAMAGLTLFLAPAGRRPAVAVRTLWAPTALVVAFAAAYLLLSRTHARGAPTTLFVPRSLAETAHFYLVALVDVGVPALLGGPWQVVVTGLPLRSPFVDGPVLVMLAVATAVFVRRRRGGWLLVLLALGYAAVSWGLLLGSSRFDAFQDLIVRDVRYAVDAFPVAVLAAVLALSPTVVERADGTTWWRSRPGPRWWHARLPRLPRPRAVLVGVAVAVTCSVAIGNTWSWSTLLPRSSKPWVDTAIAELTAAGHASVFDRRAPENVAQREFGEEARISNLFRPLHLPIAFDQPSTDLRTVADSGRLVPLVVDARSSSRTPAPVPGCGYQALPGQHLSVPLDNALFDWEWAVAVTYYTQEAGLADLDVGGTTWRVALPAGLHTLTVVTTSAISEVGLTTTGTSTPVCVTEVHAGLPAAGPGATP